MRYFFFLIIGSLLLTGCFTVNTLQKAQLDRKPERVDSVLASYKDANGNAVIVYTKQNDRSIYKTVIPLDTIIGMYRASYGIDFVNPDTTIDNFTGVFYTDRIKCQPYYQRIILLDHEVPLKDTSGLYREIGNNTYLVNKYTGRLPVPVVRNSVMYHRFITAPSVSFMVQPIKNSSSKREEAYIIAFAPGRRKYGRYFLLPLTAGLDGVTLPFQFIGVMVLYVGIVI